MTTWILFWGSIREPFIKKILGDEEYLREFTHGFSTMPTPAQLKASLEEQLSVSQLRAAFRKYIKSRVAHENLDFYQDSLQREEVEDFFERQAVTMRIINQYIVEDAQNQINLSDECRKRVLNRDVTSHNIFDEAREEVLKLMEANFAREFAQTEEFIRIADDAQREQAELKLLRKEGLAPTTPVFTPPSGLSGLHVGPRGTSCGDSQPSKHSSSTVASTRIWKPINFKIGPRGSWRGTRHIVVGRDANA
ncbi:unnamed protein product, partial [Discosporangium mesarthrocarpum]